MSDGSSVGGASSLGGGGKSAGGAGAGDPFSMFGGGGGDLLGGGSSLFGGGPYGGGDLTGLMDFAGDPTGAIGAESGLTAGGSPTTPGGGIGGALSDAQQTSPSTAQGAPAVPTTPETGTAAVGAMRGSQPILPSQFTPAAFQIGGPQTVPGPTGPLPTPVQSQTPMASSDFPMGQQDVPQSFAQRYGTDLSALGQQALAGRMTGSSAGLPPWLTSDTTQSPLDVTQTPGTFPDQPAPAPDTTSAAPSATTPSTTPTPAAATPTAAAATPSAGDTGTTRQPSAAPTAPAAGGGQPQAFNIPNIIQALLRGGPMSALEELVREAMGQGTRTPAMASTGAEGAPSADQYAQLYRQYQQAYGRPPPGPTPQQYQPSGTTAPAPQPPPAQPAAVSTPPPGTVSQTQWDQMPPYERAELQREARLQPRSAAPAATTGAPSVDAAANAAIQANPAMARAIQGDATAGASSPPTRGDPRGLRGYISQTARKYGIDPHVALRVAQSEGLGNPVGDRGMSHGAFQLYSGGGLGNVFQRQTGLNPADPRNERATIDFALRYASQHGWGPWHGAARVGIGQWQGIGANRVAAQ